jgi:hypothetical protein
VEGVRGTAGDANARLSGERACAEWCPRYIVVKMCRCERRFVFVRWRRPRIPTLDLNPESCKTLLDKDRGCTRLALFSTNAAVGEDYLESLGSRMRPGDGTRRPRGRFFA